MVQAFPLDKAHFLALFLDTIVYGIFLTFFIILLTICSTKSKVQPANAKFVLSVATLMMVLATAHLIVEFVRGMQGFTSGDVKKPPAPIPFYAHVADPLDITRNLLYGIQTVLGDGVLVWRCYVVYRRSLWVLIPASVFLLGNLALAIVVAWSFSQVHLGSNYYATGAWKFIASFVVITMTLNVTCTGAIILKVWQAHRRISSMSDRSLLLVMAVIIESGAIYTASSAVFVITLLLRSNGQHAALSLITPLVGVVFCLIVLQIHSQLKILKPVTTNLYSTMQFGRRDGPRVEGVSDSGTAIAVEISEHKRTDQESDMGIDLKTV